MAAGIYFYSDNKRNYERYKWIYDQATSTEEGVEKPPISAENALVYRDLFRRYRDYSILAVALSYLIQVVDANVFAYMQDFEVNDDISLRVEPSIQQSLGHAYAVTPPAVGMSIGLKF
jgi:hypothetical protein